MFLWCACNPAGMDFKKTSDTKLDVICVPGQKVGVWLDRNADGSAEGEPYLGSFVAYSGTLTAANNYNYYSVSAHPITGPQPVGFKTTVFFYEGLDGLALNFFSNIDEGGSTDNIQNWDITTTNNARLDSVLLSDDPGELQLYSSTTTTETQVYRLRSHYWSNTDGGVIGPFDRTDFRIAVKVLSSGDNIDAAFYSANGTILPLKDGDTPVSSFIIGSEGFETCP
jgi:hypothetical protein